MGMLRILVCLIWAAISIAALYNGDQVIQFSQDVLQRNLSLVQENLGILNDLLDETSGVLISVEESLSTLRDAIVGVTLALTDTRPLLDEASQVITQDVPEALDGLQDSMPTLIETAAAVDDTLTFLSVLQFTIPNFFGEDWVIGLGVDYNPAVPLDQALADLSTNLEDVPDDLRGMENDLNTTSTHLLTLRDDLAVLADDLYQVNQQVDDLEPHMQALSENLLEMQSSFQGVEEKYSKMLLQIRMVYLAFFSLILVGQVPSAYIGFLLMRGKEKTEKINQDDED